MGFWRNHLFGAEFELVEHHDTSLEQIIIAQQLQDLSIQTRSKLSVAAVLRARQMNADTLSSLPLKVSETQLVPAPNDEQDTQEFVTEIVLAMQDEGQAFVRLTRNGEMRVLHNQDMVVTWNTDRTRRVFTYRNVEQRTRGLTKNLYVLPINRRSVDVSGFGWLQSSRITGILETQKYIEQYFANNAKPSGILKSPREPTADEAKLIKEQWDSARAVRSTAIMPQSWEFDSLGFSPNDSSWAEAYMVGVGDVATLSGVPGSLLNYNQPGSSLTYENVESVYQGYWRQTLKPSYASRITAMWTDVLGVQVRFDPEELFLASIQDRAQAASVLANSGYDVVESAVVVGLPPISASEQESVNVGTS